MPNTRRHKEREAGVTATEDAYGAILDMILNQELRPGERTSVNLLAARLKTGKTPIKEAIILLRTEGLLSVSGRSGTTINEISGSQAMEMFAVRHLIEDFVSDFVVENITSAQLSQLHAHLRTMRKLTGAKAHSVSAEFVRANRAFHLTIVASSGNATITRLYDQLQIHSQIMSYLLAYQSDPVAAAQKRQEEHEAMVRAIEKGDASLLKKLQRAHTAASEKIILEQLANKEARQNQRPAGRRVLGQAARSAGLR